MHGILAFIFIIASAASSSIAFANDLDQRFAFYDSTPITDSTIPSVLSALAADIPVLKSQGVVFNPVPKTSQPYPQAGYEIDFSKSKMSDQTKKLALQWQKSRNYFAIRGQFKNCGLPVDGRDLGNRIVAAAAQVRLEEMDCKQLMNDTDPRIKDLEKVNQAFISSELEDLVINKALESAGKAYGYASKRYPGASSKEWCGAGGSLTSETFAHQECSGAVFETLSKAIKTGAKDVTPTSISAITGELNERVDALNLKLNGISTNDLAASFNPSVKPNITPDVQEKYNEYTELYNGALGAQDGDLLNTDKLQDETGAMRTLEKDGVNHHGTVTYPSHNRVDDKGVMRGIQEDRDDLRYQMSLLNDMYIDKKNVEGYNPSKPNYREPSKNMDDLKRLLKDNPAAVGQALMEFPEAAPTICSAISEVQHDDARTKTRDHYFAVGLGVAGAATLAFGAGAWLLAGSAALAEGGAVATAVTVGSVLGAAGAASSAHTAYKYYQEYEGLERSILSHTGDAQSRKEATQALADFSQARKEAIINGVMSVGDLGILGGIAKASSGGLTELNLMKQVVSDAQKISVNGKIVKGLFEKIDAALGTDITLKGTNALAKAMKYFGQASESMRLKLLGKLAKASPERIAKIFREAIELGKKSCG